MGYTALKAMRKKNREKYGMNGTVHIPNLVNPRGLEYGQQALEFIRENCVDLKFDTTDPKRIALNDFDGRSSGKNQIPYNMERDLDRLSFELAISRFLESGSREDAFDIYFCYFEIFKPFDDKHNRARLLLDLLSEHEANASSLVMKHRDHYSHSVYVFLLGLAIYRNHEPFRKAYNQKYGFSDDITKESAYHFLEHWGMTSLFHDIGYPFEIAHQQMKSYVDSLHLDDPKSAQRKVDFSPFVSYGNMKQFARAKKSDLNKAFAKEVFTGLKLNYLDRIRTYIDPDPVVQNSVLNRLESTLRYELSDRAVFSIPKDKNYHYMDHAYFSALILAKTYLKYHNGINEYEQIPEVVRDCFFAILLHNSLFKHTLQNILFARDGSKKKTISQPMQLNDGQPLAYLLMLCDELQCWNRTSYGQQTRKYVYAFDFDMSFPTPDSMGWIYYYDSTYADKVESSESWKKMSYNKQLGDKNPKKKTSGRSKFVDSINEIIQLKDMVPDYVPDKTMDDPSDVIYLDITTNTKRTGAFLSSSNYLNLYEFAVALNGAFDEPYDGDYYRAFDENLSLEYKLSNIAQAKGFAAQLKSIGCFYTDHPVDFPPVTSFQELILEPGHAHDWEIVSKSEHERWCAEKTAMGWRYGTAHCKTGSNDKRSKKQLRQMRECTRKHDDLVKYYKLNRKERFKNSNPMQTMLELILKMEGLIVYRMEE